MKIVSVEAIPFRLPLRRDFRWAGLRVALGGFVVVRVRTDDGIVGYGEATPLPDWGGDDGRQGGETQASVVVMVRDVLGPALLGSDPCSVQAAYATMNAVLRGNVYAKNAVDMALHDIWGKTLGQPIYRLLGGPVRPSVALAHMVGLMPENDAVEEALGAAADGVVGLQIKGGVDPERDIRIVERLGREIGDKVSLRLDANQGYRHVKDAIRYIERMAGDGLRFIEQPVQGLAAMAEVRRQVPIPVIADETAWGPADALDVVRHQAADCLSIYLAKAGGFVGAGRVGVIAAAASMRCDVNGSIESGIGNAANVHLALATASIDLPAVIPVSAPAGTHPYRIAGNYYSDDVICAPFKVEGGRILPLDLPGLGIEVDEDKLAHFSE